MTIFSLVPTQLLEPERSKYVTSWRLTFVPQISLPPGRSRDFETCAKTGRFPRLPRVYHKVSKVMSLILDASMNIYFMRIVQKQLIEPGLNKYKPLVGHNLRIVCIVLLMDVSFEELTVCFGREVMHVIDFIGRYLTSGTN